MKTHISKEEIDYIKSKLEIYNNISIYMGSISSSVMEKLRRYFCVTTERFGYYRFEKL